MKKIGFKAIRHATTRFLKDHGSEILITIGVTGTITAIGMAIKATPKAITKVKEAQKEKDEPLTNVDKVKACWKCYIPMATVEVSSILCFIGASAVSKKRYAALAAAYAISETALNDYNEKMIEVVGEDEAKAVKEKIIQKKLAETPIPQEMQYNDIPPGKVRCFDAFCGRYFYASRSEIDWAFNEMVKAINMNNTASLNDFYYKIAPDLENSIGEQLGWNIWMDTPELAYSSQLDYNGNPCLVVDFSTYPIYEYWKG